MRAVSIVLVLAACGDDPAVTSDASPSDAPLGAARPVIGSIEVVESRVEYTTSETRHGRVVARFYDGEGPRWHVETMRAGACVLRTYLPTSCTPACTSSLCIDHVCEPWPAIVSAGRLSVTGLTVGVQIDPMGGFYYTTTAIPAELFAESATVTASLAGAAVPAMTLSTTGVPAVVAAIQQGKITVPFPAEQDVEVRWTPASGDSRVRVTLNADNQGHGLPYLAIIECDAADSAGLVAIPKAMLDAFPDTRAGQACAGTDCPPSTIRRYHRATHPIGERDVELIVASELQFRIEHDVP